MASPLKCLGKDLSTINDAFGEDCAAGPTGGQMNSDLQMSDGQYLAVLVSVNMYRTSSLCSLDQVP